MLVLLASASVAPAQTYPTKPVCTVVAFAAGGTTDIRYVTPGLEPVESTPGQFGTYIRTELVKWGDIIVRAGTKLE